MKKSRAILAAAALFSVGVILGTILDDMPEESERENQKLSAPMAKRQPAPDQLEEYLMKLGSLQDTVAALKKQLSESLEKREAPARQGYADADPGKGRTGSGETPSVAGRAEILDSFVRTDSGDGPRLDQEYFFLSVEPKKAQSGPLLNLSRGDRLYCNIRALNCQTRTIWFQWQHAESDFLHQWKYRIPDHAAWRAFAEKRIGKRMGRWRVSVYHTSIKTDNLLGHIEFVVR